jgi:flagellar hook capping protein FlgD
VNGGPCEWNYVLNDGTGWSSIVKTLIPERTDFSYVVATFVNDSTLWVAGEALGGGGDDPWTYALGAGRVVLGHSISDFAIMPGDNLTAADIWFNKRTGLLHLLGDGRNNELTYYHRTLDGQWPAVAETLSVSGGAYRASRFIDTPDDALYLALTTPTGLKLKQLNKNTFHGKADIDSAHTFDIHSKVGFNITHAIFPERPEFQTTPVGAINFAYPGNDYEFAKYLKHLEIRRTWPVTPEALRTPRSSSLSPNIPNPFNPSTAIRFTVARTGFVSITIHDLTGRTVAELIARSLSAGDHSVVWNARDSRGRVMGSGMYLCRMSGPDGTSVRRITLAR